MKAIKRIIYVCCVALIAAGCIKEDDALALKGTSECSYKVMIDGYTAIPNQFGQDKIGITTGMGENSFGFRITQAKANPKEESVMDVIAYNGRFNSKLPEGDYPADFFGATSFKANEFGLFPLYAFDEKGEWGDVSFKLLENSDQRIRMKVSGVVMKQDLVGDEAKELGLVPVEAEITIGRKYYSEATIDGVLVGGAICKCQN